MALKSSIAEHGQPAGTRLARAWGGPPHHNVVVLGRWVLISACCCAYTWAPGRTAAQPCIVGRAACGRSEFVVVALCGEGKLRCKAFAGRALSRLQRQPGLLLTKAVHLAVPVCAVKATKKRYLSLEQPPAAEAPGPVGLKPHAFGGAMSFSGQPPAAEEAAEPEAVHYFIKFLRGVPLSRAQALLAETAGPEAVRYARQPASIQAACS